MPLLHFLSRPLRAFLVLLHPTFSCCASCGEIQTPVQGRLCASLRPAFPVDGVIPAFTPAWKDIDMAAAIAALRSGLPFLRRLFLVRDADAAPAVFPGEAVSISVETLRQQTARTAHAGGNLPAHALFHTLPGLAEHFVILRDPFPWPPFPQIPQSPQPLDPLDVFTPNGIPLVSLCPAREPSHAETAFTAFLAEGGLPADPRLAFAAGLNALTGESAAEFLPLYAEFIARHPENFPEYAAAFALWAYTAGRAVPRGEVLADRVLPFQGSVTQDAAPRNASARSAPA